MWARMFGEAYSMRRRLGAVVTAAWPHAEDLVRQGVPGLREEGGCARVVCDDFLKETAFELNLKGCFQFLARRIMVALKV